MPLFASAQIATGYYRVKNAQTGRYMSIVDTKAEFKIGASYANYVLADLEAIYMLSDFEGQVAFNPASICYVRHIGDANSTLHNLSGQGLDLYRQTENYLNAIERNGYYRFYATGSASGMSVTRYLIDNTYHGTHFYPSVGDESTTNSNRNWEVLAVDQSDAQYFGVKPDVQTSDGTNWATLYAGFPFRPSDEQTKVYTVSKIDQNGYAVISEVADGIVTVQSPVLVKCAGAAPVNNKMTLLAPGTKGNMDANFLIGNYYCNDVEGKHRNVVEYKPATMRVLGLTSSGRLAFVKSNISYLPANKAYIQVAATAADELIVVTEEEYIAAGIHEVSSAKTDGQQVVYDLQGRRVTAPSKGLYIVNGKKVIIR